MITHANLPASSSYNGLTHVAAATTTAPSAMAPKRARNSKGQHKPEPAPQKRVKVQVRIAEAFLYLVLMTGSLQNLDEY